MYGSCLTRATRWVALPAFAGLLTMTAAAQSLQLGRVQTQPAQGSMHVLHVLVGDVDGDRFGTALATVPDLDGDGFDDLLVGAPNRKSETYSTIGHAYVFSSATGLLLREHTGWSKGDRFGHSVARLGDLDGDGVDDYGGGAIWAVNPENPDSGPQYPGRVRVVSGASGLTLFELPGEGEGECFGASLGALSDVDGDGTPEFMVGVRLAGATPGSGWVKEGEVRLLSGATGQVLGLSQGEGSGDWLGGAAAMLGDQDGDGSVDVAAGAFGYPAGAMHGMVRVLSGSTASTMAEFTGSTPGEGYGYAVATLPDLDGDGRQELAVGAPYFDGNRGRVEIVSPSTGASLLALEGLQSGEHFGIAVSPAADLDGDGKLDVAVGASFWGDEQGRVLILSSVSGKLLASLIGPGGPGERLGETLHLMPDLTGDGLPELAVGAPLSPVPLHIGRVFIVSPRP